MNCLKMQKEFLNFHNKIGKNPPNSEFEMVQSAAFEFSIILFRDEKVNISHFTVGQLIGHMRCSYLAQCNPVLENKNTKEVSYAIHEFPIS